MSEQSGYVLEEAVKLFVTLRRRMRDSGPADDDVWGRATHESAGGSHFATGAPECQYCPICRTVAAARTSGTDVVGHVMDAGQALVAAMRETVAAYDRSRPARPRADGDPIDVG
ncbi:hypothetical protein [Actinomadura sp. HBU206391]|uniref:hypothetical protein n=1 Tax=Actinomadura sp. HBU206391 TaxID=2731692 RepID=UPI00165054D2|nr:hypothetical protein [Actinomadura sp. HBU206391]MBC6462954.1 hypothetical protein [Actinomadura sp. HBU206391]